MQMNFTREFSFAHPISIHRVTFDLFRFLNLKLFPRLKQAHPKLSLTSFLGWRLRLGSDGVR